MNFLFIIVCEHNWLVSVIVSWEIEKKIINDNYHHAIKCVCVYCIVLFFLTSSFFSCSLIVCWMDVVHSNLQSKMKIIPFWTHSYCCCCEKWKLNIKKNNTNNFESWTSCFQICWKYDLFGLEIEIEKK